MRTLAGCGPPGYYTRQDMDRTTPSISITTASADETQAFGAHLGARLKGGEVIELVSDLGGGKTTFVKGVAHGMGSTERVTSPTFTVLQEYAAGKLTLYHFDFYRLQEAGIMADELAEVAGDPQGVTIVEWGDVARHVLPDASLRITITATGEQERTLEFRCPPAFAYLVEGLPSA